MIIVKLFNKNHEIWESTHFVSPNRLLTVRGIAPRSTRHHARSAGAASPRASQSRGRCRPWSGVLPTSWKLPA